MNTNTQFCSMQNKTQHNSNTVSGIFLLILGVLITVSLLVLKQFNILHLNLDVVFAPFVVITLLAYGNKILIYFLLTPLSFIIKLINKVRGSSQKQELNLKQSQS